MANGKPVRKLQKVPVNSAIVIEIADGRLTELQDSLRNMELLNYYQENPNTETTETEPSESYGEETGQYESIPQETPSENEGENNQYF